MSEEQEQRRYLIAIGSPAGGDGFPDKLNCVEKDIKRVVDLFTTQEQGYQRVLQDVSLGVMAHEIKAALTGWFSSEERRESDCVIVYYAGHGGEGEKSLHYLYTAGSRPGNLQGTAIETSDLVKWFFEGSNEYPQNVLLILDVCSGGLGAQQIIANLTRGGTNTTRSKGFWIFCSSTDVDTADDGAFVQALEAVMKDHEWRINENSLSLLTLKDEINKHLKKIPQVAEINAISTTNPDRFIRNPGFVESKKGVLVTLRSPTSLNKDVRKPLNDFYIPRKSSKRFVDAIKAEITTLEATHFIFHSHGIGGIGKSTFLKKIQEELRDIAIFLDVSFEDSKMDSPLNLMKCLHLKLPSPDQNNDPFLNLLKKYETLKHRLVTEPFGEISEVSIEQHSLFNEYESNRRKKIDSLYSESKVEALGDVSPLSPSITNRLTTLLSQQPKIKQMIKIFY